MDYLSEFGKEMKRKDSIGTSLQKARKGVRQYKERKIARARKNAPPLMSTQELEEQDPYLNNEELRRYVNKIRKEGKGDNFFRSYGEVRQLLENEAKRGNLPGILHVLDELRIYKGYLTNADKYAAQLILKSMKKLTPEQISEYDKQGYMKVVEGYMHIAEDLKDTKKSARFTKEQIEKQNILEEKVRASKGMSFWQKIGFCMFILGNFLGIFFLSSNFTGNVINGLNSTSSNIVGITSILVAIIGAIFYFIRK